MKVIILLGGRGTRLRPYTWSRPKALLSLAGNTVLGHILERMSEVTGEEVIFVVGDHGATVEAWVRENYPGFDAHFVRQEEPLGQAHAVWLCRDFLQDERDVIVAFGDGIIEADFAAISSKADDENADAVFLVTEVDDARDFGVALLDEAGCVSGFVEKPETEAHNLLVVGANWFRSSRRLYEAVDTVIREQRQTLGEYYMVDAYQVMLERGDRLITMEARQWEDTGQPGTLLRSNARLLASGYHSPDAIERSYAEEFSVLPPVYLHPAARIDGSVIGPYVTVGPDVTIRDAIIRNSIVDRGATVQHCLLDGALIGEEAQVNGRAKALFIGDNAVVELD